MTVFYVALHIPDLKVYRSVSFFFLIEKSVLGICSWIKSLKTEIMSDLKGHKIPAHQDLNLGQKIFSSFFWLYFNIAVSI